MQLPADVQAYAESVDPALRPLLDRVVGVVARVCPDAEAVISYRIPAFRHGRHTLFVGAWKHGISLYGWHDGHDGGFVEQHPGTVHGRSTIRLSAERMASLPEADLEALVAAALDA